MISNKNNQFIYFRLSLQYLHLVESVLEELIKQGNNSLVISDDPISDSELYDKTKWGDFNIAEPLLFNFYHGLELLLKGYLKKHNEEVSKKRHNLFSLFESFNLIFNDANMSSVLQKYIGKNSELVEPLNQFFTNNNITVSQYYEALRYPEVVNSSYMFSHNELRYLNKNGMEFFSTLKNDIDNLKRDLIKYCNQPDKKRCF